jgi:hypothetical protein
VSDIAKNQVEYSNSTHLSEERLSLDSCSVSFFRLSMYKDLSFEHDTLATHFQKLCTLMFHEDTKGYCRYRSRFFYFFFYRHFLEDFSFFLQHHIQPLKSPWLLKSCEAAELSGLDIKASGHYFKDLERRLLAHKISGLQTPSTFLKMEYQRLQIQYFFSLLKKYIPFLLFWILAVFVTYFCLFFAAKGNSFTILEQVQAWVQFISSISFK